MDHEVKQLLRLGLETEALPLFFLIFGHTFSSYCLFVSVILPGRKHVF
jgi:hypothetical protein